MAFPLDKEKLKYRSRMSRMQIVGRLKQLFWILKQSAVMAYQIQTQLPEKVSHLEAETIKNTKKHESFSRDWV